MNDKFSRTGEIVTISVSGNKEGKMYSTALKEIDLTDKCGSCKHYKQLVKVDHRMGFEVHYCRGSCELKKLYKQRTDDICKKYEVLAEKVS